MDKEDIVTTLYIFKGTTLLSILYPTYINTHQVVLMVNLFTVDYLEEALKTYTKTDTSSRSV